MSILRWIYDSTLRTAAGLAVLGVITFLGAEASHAALTTSWTVTNNPQMNLNQSITASQTTGIQLAGLRRNGVLVTFPTTTGGVLRIKQGSTVEDISYTSATVNATTKVVTLVGVTRNLCWNVADSLTSCGNGSAFSKGATVELNIDARLLNFKLDSNRINVLTGSGRLTSEQVRSAYLNLNCVTTAQRDAFWITEEGDLICNTTTSTFQHYIGGGWSDIGTSGVPFATLTVAGKVEIGTGSDLKLHTGTGDSGAKVVVPTELVTATGGTSNAFKVPLLNASGQLDTTMLAASAFADAYGDGSDGDVTINGDTTLTRDMYYNNLTIQRSILSTAQWRVFVRGTLTVTGTGSMSVSGNAGGAGGSGASGGARGASGALVPAGYFPATKEGSQGGLGSTGTGNNGGNPGKNQSYSICRSSIGAGGSMGGKGGKAQDGTTPISSAGGSGTTTIIPTIKNLFNAYIFNSSTGGTIVMPRCGAGSGGGQQGGGDSGARVGGGGGGGGASAGTLFVAANTITGAVNFTAVGGNGGAGGDGQSGAGNAGSGGGGGGGAGGIIVLIYHTRTLWTGSLSVAGGTGGAAGTQLAGTTAAAAGNPGRTGVTFQFQY